MEPWYSVPRLSHLDSNKTGTRRSFSCSGNSLLFFFFFFKSPAAYSAFASSFLFVAESIFVDRFQSSRFTSSRVGTTSGCEVEAMFDSQYQSLIELLRSG